MRRGLAPVSLILLALAVFWPGLHGGFIFDDYPNLVRTPDWRLTDLTDASQWMRAVGHGLSSMSGRPLAMASFALNHYFSGLDPFWMKLTNLLLHGLNGALVLRLCNTLFSRPSQDQDGTPHSAGAWLIAAAWTLHPLQVSTVLYTVQRMEIGATTFTLLSLLAYLHARGLQIAGKHAWPWLITAGALFLAALGFKETALLIPGYALLLEATILRFANREGSISKGWLWTYAAALVAATTLFAGIVVPHYASADAYAARDFTSAQRLLTQMPVLAHYIEQILLPLPSKLVFYYDDFPVSTHLWLPPTTLLAAAVIGALIAIAWRLRNSCPMVTLGIGWFFIGHALTSNIVPLELAFEHRNYLPLLGVLLALQPGLQWATRKLAPAVRHPMAGAALALLALLCLLQASAWGDSHRLTRILADRNPDSARAAYGLGVLRLQAAGNDPHSEQWSLARKVFSRVTQLDPGGTLGNQALLIMDGRSRRPIAPARWDALRERLTHRDKATPEVYSTLFALNQCRIQARCVWDDREMVQTLLAVIGHYPDDATAHALYGNYALNVLGDVRLASDMLREAVRLDPGNAQLLTGLAKTLLTYGEPQQRVEANRIIGQLERMNEDGHLDSDLALLRRMIAPASGTASHQ